MRATSLRSMLDGASELGQLVFLLVGFALLGVVSFKAVKTIARIRIAVRRALT